MEIVREYTRLSALSTLSDVEAERLAEILGLALDDDVFEFLINEAEIFLAHDQNLLDEDSIHYYKDQQAKLSEYLPVGSKNVWPI
jgi:hypothetical protein